MTTPQNCGGRWSDILAPENQNENDYHLYLGVTLTMVVLKDKARSPLALAISAALAVTFAAPAGAHTGHQAGRNPGRLWQSTLRDVAVGGDGRLWGRLGHRRHQDAGGPQRHPQSITVLTNDYIEERNFVAVDDLAKFTPGLRTLVNDSGRSSIFSRGYGIRRGEPQRPAIAHAEQSTAPCRRWRRWIGWRSCGAPPASSTAPASWGRDQHGAQASDRRLQGLGHGALW